MLEDMSWPDAGLSAPTGGGDPSYSGHVCVNDVEGGVFGCTLGSRS